MLPRSRTSVWLFVVAGALVAVIATMLFVPGARQPAHSIAIEPATAIPLTHEKPPALDLDSTAAPRIVAAPEMPPAPPAPTNQSPAPEPAHPTIRIVGTVSDPSGRRVEDPHAQVVCNDARGQCKAPIVASAFRFEGLEPGPVILVCTVSRFREQTRTITLSAGEVERREDFVLESAWAVAIRFLTPEGKNLSDPELQKEIPKEMKLDVLAMPDAPPDRWIPRSFEDRRARHGSRWVPERKADGASAGMLMIYGSPPMHVSATINGFVVATTLLESKVDHATLEIRIEDLRRMLCSLRIRVVDGATGAPLPSARAHSYTQDGNLSLEADADGILRGTDLLPGNYSLSIGAPSRSDELIQVDLLPGRENNLGTITLDSGVNLRGHFVDPEGRPVRSDAFVFPFFEDRPLETFSTKMVFGLDVEESGSFEVEGLARRKYLLVNSRASSPLDRSWRPLPTVVDLSHGSVEDLVLPVRAASDLLMKLESEEDRDLGYWVLTQDGLPCTHGGFAAQGDTFVTLFSGRFRLLVGRDPMDVREIPFQLGSEPSTISIPH